MFPHLSKQCQQLLPLKKRSGKKEEASAQKRTGKRIKLMISEYFKMAISSIRSAKVRSALTMFGIIIGVSSVVTIVGLGEGVKQQVNK